MKENSVLFRYYQNLNPFWKNAALYSFVFSIIAWANYTFMRYRVVENALFSLLPDAGTIMMYLWLILFFDEFLYILKSFDSLAVIIRKIKMFSFAFIALYALMAFALLINRTSITPVTIKSSKIVSLSSPRSGEFNYGKMTVEGWDDKSTTRNILLTSREATDLYAGEDVEIVTRKGVLFLDRVLEVRRDMEKFYTKMLKAAPDSKVAIRGLIDINAQKSRFDEAVKWYGTYIAKFPDDDKVGYGLGWRLVEGKRFGEATVVLKKVIETDRDYDNLYFLGYALAWAGMKYEAEKYLREATELDPTDFRAFYSLGYVYNDTGRYEKAKESWSMVLRLMPRFPEVENNLKTIEQRIKAAGRH